jgi:excinuclease UvrABC nuclease subunit
MPIFSAAAVKVSEALTSTARLRIKIKVKSSGDIKVRIGITEENERRTLDQKGSKRGIKKTDTLASSPLIGRNR